MRTREKFLCSKIAWRLLLITALGLLIFWFKLVPAASGEWSFCANENEYCSFSGTKEVRYGADGQYAYGTYTDGVDCTNDVFGDPIYGTVKSCDVFYNKPHISLSPTSFTFSGISGGPTPAGQTLTISNTGGTTLKWSGSTNQGWCHISNPNNNVNVNPGSSVTRTITVDAPSNVGSFSCNVTISDANADNSPQTASVTYNVSAGSCPSGSVSLNPTSINIGQTSTASAPSGFTGGSFSSSNTGVATISGSTATGVGPGQAAISGTGWSYPANGATGCSLSSSSLTVISAPPAAPSNAQTDNSVCGKVTITWTDNSSNETGFHVYRSKSGKQGSIDLSDYELIASVSANTTAYTDSTVSTGKSYSYAVTSYK